MLRVGRREAREHLVGHLGLRRPQPKKGKSGVRALLEQLRCIQLDPLDPFGQNADLVALARVDGIGRGDVYKHLLPGHAFEHFAKERCLLPASAFPYYQSHAAETLWWRMPERMRRITESDLDRVLADVRARGPISAADLDDGRRVAPLDWSGWKGTPRVTTLALEVLWTRCQVVVCGRSPTGKGKIYDVPERALPAHAAATPRGGGKAVTSEEFGRWGIVERVHAAGLLSRAGGPMWSMLSAARTSPLVGELLESGDIVEVAVEGSSRPYLAPRGFGDRRHARDDERMRILGPLDPILWDRKLVASVFGFEYVWEVYKPATERRWGWYVCPLLYQGELVGRLEGKIDGTTLLVERLWREPSGPWDDEALERALTRHAEACGADRVKRPPTPRPGSDRRLARRRSA